jgi:hypothetical protein
VRTVVRFDKQLVELHRTDDDKATVCGEPMPDGVPWISWPEDGTGHCGLCYGEALQEETLFG